MTAAARADSRPLLLGVDATGYLFRAFHAVRDLSAPDGHPTNAIYGLAAMLSKLARRYPDAHAACVMDAPGKTFRHEIDPQYKAQRPPLDPDLARQIEPAKDMARAAGFYLACEPAVEADDVLATLAARGRAAGFRVIIESGDKDLMQLVDGDVVVEDGMRDKIYDEDAVREKFGVPPAQMRDFLTLVGDVSDNIRGVEKVGPKTAAKWLSRCGDLAGVIKNADYIPGMVGANLRAALPRLAINQKLVSLRDDLELDFTLADLAPRAHDDEKWRALCERFGLRSLAANPPRRVAAAVAAAPPPPPIPAAQILTMPAQLAAWRERIRALKIVAVDTETDTLSALDSRLVGFSLAIKNERGEIESGYAPLRHRAKPAPSEDKSEDKSEDDSEDEKSPPRGELRAGQMPEEAALDFLRDILGDESVVKIAHNAKFDLHVFANEGIPVRGVFEDTQIAAYVLDSTAPNGLSALAERHFGEKPTEFKQVVDGKNIRVFSEVEIAAAAAYAAADAHYARRLCDDLPPRFRGEEKRIYESIDRPLAPILMRMERAGVRVDGERLRALAEQWKTRLHELETRAHAIAGEEFNLNSPRQLAAILFDKLGLPKSKKTPGGLASTREAALADLRLHHPLPDVLLEHRMLAKLVSTYAEKLPQMTNPRTGRVHTNFNQTAVLTGRLASSAPNLQNIPIRTPEGRQIRRAFTAAPGMQIVCADYSQIELRLMAHLAADDALIAAFAAGEDVHRRTAAEVFGVADLAAVTAEQRRNAKAINFGLIYGMSAFGLARNLGISQARARNYIDRYFDRYPRVARQMESMRVEGLRRGWVETLCGRRIALADAQSTDERRKSAAARVAINAPMQGGAADVIKLAMIAVDEWLAREKMRARPLLQVHDELVFEAPREEVDAMRENLPRLMREVASLRVSLEINLDVGENWDEAH